MAYSYYVGGATLVRCLSFASSFSDELLEKKKDPFGTKKEKLF